MSNWKQTKKNRLFFSIIFLLFKRILNLSIFWSYSSLSPSPSRSFTHPYPFNFMFFFKKQMKTHYVKTLQSHGKNTAIPKKNNKRTKKLESTNLQPNKSTHTKRRFLESIICLSTTTTEHVTCFYCENSFSQ